MVIGYCRSATAKGTLCSSLQEFATAAGPAVTSTPEAGPALYLDTLQTGGSAWAPLAEALAAVGQLQLLRQRIALELRNTCKYAMPYARPFLAVAMDVKYHRHVQSSKGYMRLHGLVAGFKGCVARKGTPRWPYGGCVHKALGVLMEAALLVCVGWAHRQC